MDIWWIDEPRLLGSGNPTFGDLVKLRAQGFEVIVSLLDEDVQRPYYDPARARAIGYERHNLPVEDFGTPTVGQLLEFVRLVRGLPADKKVVLHCYAGIGRTGTFAASYWIAKGLKVEDAVNRVRQARPEAVQTPAQRAVLDEFAARVAEDAEFRTEGRTCG
jgi:atypical dual specificity phosphatase